jgi:hypothetical protein
MATKNKLGSEYTPADIKTMRAMAKAGKSARECAQQLGRSRGAIAFKAMVEGISFRAVAQPKGMQRKLGRLRMKTGRMNVTLGAAA